MILTPLSLRDRAALERQMAKRRFDARTALAVACRCSRSYPQVILCRPLKGGLPFPTLFWLTCPWLVKELGRLESLGGVAQLECAFAADPEGWYAYQRHYAKLRLFLLSEGEKAWLAATRPALLKSLARGGVGGIAGTTPTAKCLHLQVGAWLGLGFHPASRQLRRMLPRVECPDPSAQPCEGAKNEF